MFTNHSGSSRLITRGASIIMFALEKGQCPTNPTPLYKTLSILNKFVTTGSRRSTEENDSGGGGGGVVFFFFGFFFLGFFFLA